MHQSNKGKDTARINFCDMRTHLRTTFSFALLGLNRAAKRSVGFVSNNRSFLTTRYISELKMAKQVLIPISDGSEEIETTCIQDTLARFGAEVTIASVKHDGDLVCKMSRGIKVRCFS